MIPIQKEVEYALKTFIVWSEEGLLKMLESSILREKLRPMSM